MARDCSLCDGYRKDIENCRYDKCIYPSESAPARNIEPQKPSKPRPINISKKLHDYDIFQDGKLVRRIRIHNEKLAREIAAIILLTEAGKLVAKEVFKK